MSATSETSVRSLFTYLRYVAIDTPIRIFQWAGVVICTLLLVFILKYRSSIKKSLKEMDAHRSKGLVYRDKESTPQKVVKVLELHRDFVETHQESWQLCSLGEYLNSLRFITDKDIDSSSLPKILERELQVAMGTAILQSFGPRLGRAILPLIGTSKVENFLGRLVSNFLSWIIAHVMVQVDSQDWDPIGDKACLPFNVAELMGFVNLNQKFRSLGIKPTPLKCMSRGETGYDPSYCTLSKEEREGKADKPETKGNSSPSSDANTTNPASKQKELLPNPFVVEQHFEAAIRGLEDRIRGQKEVTDTTAQAGAEQGMTTAAYDPLDRSLPEPTAINPTILPGLYMGWGLAQCTHTKREILRNRLFAVLLTKLSYNYHLWREGKRRDCFVVQYNGTKCQFPDEFVQALMDTGHKVEICPRSAITTFGLAACIKEDDGSWTNVPMAFFFRTGYERFDQRPAYFSAPHGGIDMNIKGPLVGTDAGTGKSHRCDIQFYMAIEGMCGWNSNHNADVPWIKSVSTTDIYDKETALKAIRMSGLLACTFNSIGTEMDLPFGGYGVLGVCNDTAALVDFAVRGSTNMYPLLSTGRFLMHTASHLKMTCDELSKHDEMATVAKDARRLASAACFMESDIHCSPTQLIGAVRRFNANYPQSYFQITDDSRELMQHLSDEYQQFLDATAKVGIKSEVAFKDYLAHRASFQEETEANMESEAL